MITDEMLRKAAEKSSAVYVRYLEQDFDPAHQHDFSPQFEKKMSKIRWKVNHRFLQRVASFFLAMLIGGAVWLSVDVEARAIFFGWIKEFYETYIVYRFESDLHTDAVQNEYRPTWLPDGYKEVDTDVSGDTVTVFYLNDDGQGLIFCYSNNYEGTNWFIDPSSTIAKESYVNQAPADIYIDENYKTANSIVWILPNDTAFYVSAFLSENDLIKVAESVRLNLG